MKKMILLSLMLAAFTSAAFAADKSVDLCAVNDCLSSQISGKPLSCIRGKEKNTGRASATQIILSVQLLEGDRLLTSSRLTTMDGQMAGMRVGSERSYVAETTKNGNTVVMTADKVEDGFFTAALTPTLTKDGNIEVEFDLKKSDLTSIQRFTQGDHETQLPQVSAINLKQKISLVSGKEAIIPFGPLVDTGTADAGKSSRTQYTLRIVATKA